MDKLKAMEELGHYLQRLLEADCLHAKEQANSWGISRTFGGKTDSKLWMESSLMKLAPFQLG
jgi:hypothetical protein